jgi:NMD protein affecting ribosome stability and mRNA decay
MRQICYECGILYGIREPLDDDSVTSGLCDECFEITKKKIEAILKKRKEARAKGLNNSGKP